MTIQYDKFVLVQWSHMMVTLSNKTVKDLLKGLKLVTS